MLIVRFCHMFSIQHSHYCLISSTLVCFWPQLGFLHPPASDSWQTAFWGTLESGNITRWWEVRGEKENIHCLPTGTCNKKTPSIIQTGFASIHMEKWPNKGNEEEICVTFIHLFTPAWPSLSLTMPSHAQLILCFHMFVTHCCRNYTGAWKSRRTTTAGIVSQKTIKKSHFCQ